MSELKGQPPNLYFTVTVKRAATGKEETYQMVGHVIGSEQSEQPKELDHDGNSQHGE